MGLRETLRETTRERHAELDSMLGSLRPFSSTERYAIYLRGMLLLYESFGEALDRCAEVAKIAPRRDALVGALVADLSSCGNSVAVAAVAEPLGEFEEAACWGAAYVLEGSAMGAQMLVRQAAELPQPVTNHFLAALAGDGATRFRAFCAALDGAAIDDGRAIAGAELVFKHAIEWYAAQLRLENTSLAT